MFYDGQTPNSGDISATDTHIESMEALDRLPNFENSFFQSEHVNIFVSKCCIFCIRKCLDMFYSRVHDSKLSKFLIFLLQISIRIAKEMMMMSEWTKIIAVNLMLIAALYTSSIGMVFYQRWYLKVSNLFLFVNFMPLTCFCQRQE